MNITPFQSLACPLDGKPLRGDGTTWRCAAEHSFDTASQGYTHLLPVQQKLHAGESVVIDCSQLVRMDFGAAGSVLNWSAEMQGAGHAVRFVKLQQLVAVFFNIVGVGEHSLIVPRKD